MKIKLSPQRRDDVLVISKTGDALRVNGLLFDFSQMAAGDTLPRAAIKSEWFAGNVDRLADELVVTLLLPNPWNYSPEQAFPADLVRVPDGDVLLPRALPNPDGAQTPAVSPDFTEDVGIIDWSQLITAEMKAASAQAERLAESKSQLAARNTTAAVQIDRITDRIETLGYGIEAGEATPEDEAERAALMISLKAWKAYKFALGKVTAQATWPTAPVWPAEPAIPEIEAAPMLVADEEI
ncbi:hypothetical protein C4K35_4688 [Pseudomonas chlororaphis subsp. piscium]|nr:hypothetical protein C4K35_4688 [Pseudomonas chlororaphis subsp. piscium]AZC88431.1 hypothetical protein C4K29_2128 [Pseudomonas chlororaphis subsp. piscium]